jgi:hypothetical protein
VTRDELRRWVDAYESAWRTPGTDTLESLFTPDASYSMAPFEQPHRGLAAIRTLWDAERAGPDEAFSMQYEIVASEGDTGVVRVEVEYMRPENRIFRDLWIVTLDSDGRCTVFEEWPFSPE